jgi:tetratricopeptide (TPR) repeat protein
MNLETENILSAHAWCDHAPNGAELGLKLARGNKAYWINDGLLTLGHRVIAEALARPRTVRDELRCRALFDAGQLALFMGRYPEAQRRLEESLAIARELKNKQRITAVLQPLGVSCLGQGHYDQARVHLEEGVALTRELGNKRDFAAAMNALGSMHRMQGALDSADILYRDASRLMGEAGDALSRALIVLNHAILAILRKDAPEARVHLLEAISTSETLGLPRVGLSTIEVCSGFAASCGEYERATRFFGVAEAENSATGLHRDPADDAFLAPLIEKAREELGPRYRAIEDAGRSLPYTRAISEAREWLEKKPAAL